MSEASRLIKKYPNRRLYDTKLSAYISTQDVKELVLAGDDFTVVDAKSGEDLTRSVLLQIITEQENKTDGNPLFSIKVLSEMIKTHGESTQNMLGTYLESNIEAFVEMQKKFNEQAKTALGVAGSFPSDLFARLISLQAPFMQQMVASYIENTKKMTGIHSQKKKP